MGVLGGRNATMSFWSTWSNGHIVDDPKWSEEIHTLQMVCPHTKLVGIRTTSKRRLQTEQLRTSSHCWEKKGIVNADDFLPLTFRSLHTAQCAKNDKLLDPIISSSCFVKISRPRSVHLTFLGTPPPYRIAGAQMKPEVAVAVNGVTDCVSGRSGMSPSKQKVRLISISECANVVWYGGSVPDITFGVICLDNPAPNNGFA
ncbi:hypothetical protein RvY_19186 [Ramazzottius varieornatus]|uniref:Uncharacterized protein n=1 Tax=Ramazzottius varieornatus TaxID=947166 RepID=A0A1D1WC47_RAMVA|nr:hypothetical protein RvY_19186 [Ramazzottius varieornatus]